MTFEVTGEKMVITAALARKQAAQLQQQLIATVAEREKRQVKLRGAAAQKHRRVTNNYGRAVIESGQFAADERAAFDLVTDVFAAFEKRTIRVWRHSFGYLYTDGGYAGRRGYEVHAVIDFKRDGSVKCDIRKAGGRSGYALNSGWVD